MEQPVIAPSAYKHGVGDDTILHPFNNPIRTEHLDEDMTMLIGPDHAGNLFEIGVVTERRPGHRACHAGSLQVPQVIPCLAP